MIPTDAPTADEMMIVTSSRWLSEQVSRGARNCFVGIGLPSAAANLARLLRPPGPFLIYESGCLGVKPTRLPLSIGDGELAETADEVVSVPEVFSYWLQGGRIDVGFLGAAQIDRRANLNSTVIGDYNSFSVRLPGAGGAPEIASSAKSVAVVIRQTLRTFVERCDFRTSIGFGDDPDHRRRLGLRGAGVVRVITDLGELEPCDGELVMTSLYPGVTLTDVQDRTGWPINCAETLSTVEPPTQLELETLRRLRSA